MPCPTEKSMLMKMKPVRPVMKRMDRRPSSSVFQPLKASFSSLVSRVMPKMKKMMD